AATHALRAGDDASSDAARVPFSWSGVELHPGAPAGIRALRVCFRPLGDERFAVEIADQTGVPVASISEVVFRRPSSVTRPAPLHRLEWQAVPTEPLVAAQ